MKIIIKAEGHNIRLWFPLSILKGSIAFSVAKSSLEKHTQKQQVKQQLSKEISLNREQMAQAYNILKQFVKTHGHFNLVEVDSRNGDKVLIRV